MEELKEGYRQISWEMVERHIKKHVDAYIEKQIIEKIIEKIVLSQYPDFLLWKHFREGKTFNDPFLPSNLLSPDIRERSEKLFNKAKEHYKEGVKFLTVDLQRMVCLSELDDILKDLFYAAHKCGTIKVIQEEFEELNIKTILALANEEKKRFMSMANYRDKLCKTISSKEIAEDIKRYVDSKIEEDLIFYPLIKQNKSIALTEKGLKRDISKEKIFNWPLVKLMDLFIKKGTSKYKAAMYTSNFFSKLFPDWWYDKSEDAIRKSYKRWKKKVYNNPDLVELAQRRRNSPLSFPVWDADTFFAALQPKEKLSALLSALSALK